MSAVSSTGPIANPPPRALGVVVIGRNEGERLRRCLQSVCGVAQSVVYVDSGSSDDSVAMSRGFGVAVVDLDMRTPFTAARARNEGFARLMSLQPTLEYVFFVDGDCEVIEGWLDSGLEFLETHADYGSYAAGGANAIRISRSTICCAKSSGTTTRSATRSFAAAMR